MDWHSKLVLSWELDDTLDIGFVLEAGKAARLKGIPQIMNPGQGGQFTSPKFYEPFIEAGSHISMDHRGCAFDKIMVERLWRSVKYENVYLSDCQSTKECRSGLREYFEFYNNKRLHQSLGYITPAQAHYRK